MFLRNAAWMLIVGTWAMAGCSSSSSGGGGSSGTSSAGSSGSQSSSGDMTSSGSSGSDGSSSPDGGTPMDGGSRVNADGGDAGGGGSLPDAGSDPFARFCLTDCTVTDQCQVDGGALDPAISSCYMSSCAPKVGNAIVEQYTTAYWNAVSTCYSGSDCAALLKPGSDQTSANAICGNPVLTPSAAVTTYCATPPCPALLTSAAICEATFAPFQDSRVTALGTCMTTNGCTTQAFDNCVNSP